MVSRVYVEVEVVKISCEVALKKRNVFRQCQKVPLFVIEKVTQDDRRVRKWRRPALALFGKRQPAHLAAWEEATTTNAVKRGRENDQLARCSYMIDISYPIWVSPSSHCRRSPG